MAQYTYMLIQNVAMHYRRNNIPVRYITLLLFTHNNERGCRYLTSFFHEEEVIGVQFVTLFQADIRSSARYCSIWSMWEQRTFWTTKYIEDKVRINPHYNLLSSVREMASKKHKSSSSASGVPCTNFFPFWPVATASSPGMFLKHLLRQITKVSRFVNGIIPYFFWMREKGEQCRLAACISPCS